MSDEQPSSDESGADSSESTDADSDSSETLEPGGGPQRVVSEQSVDDILASLDETKSAAGDSSNAADETTTDTAESVTTEFDETDIPAADTVDSDGASEDSSQSAATAEHGDRAESTPSDSTETAPTPTEPAPDDTGTTDADSAAAIDAAATAIPDDTELDDDASLEELAARIEDGTVTGADVRAAEAGTGREATPDVDEIELSMDDLEATQAQSTSPNSGSESATAELGDDAGPLAGSIDRDEGDSSDEDDTQDEAVGFVGRIKRFFGG
ncbi:hypothetical protein [Natronorubrum sp. A-ect3]|uniref:hypothetical protein n=1 Tax=Natronorubrum sp. A-ect3 TaxID=3242698 RepID=UPI00359D7652